MYVKSSAMGKGLYAKFRWKSFRECSIDPSQLESRSSMLVGI
jgi:hypothetical protein